MWMPTTDHLYTPVHILQTCPVRKAEIRMKVLFRLVETDYSSIHDNIKPIHFKEAFKNDI